MIRIKERDIESIKMEEVDVVMKPGCGTKACWYPSFSRYFNDAPLRKDIEIKTQNMGNIIFKRGDLVSNKPGGVFIKPINSEHDLTRYRFYRISIWEGQIGIWSTKENLEMIISAL